MTTEEKARAYEAALERAKYYQKENGSAVISAIFPELSESENEKIRKGILELVRQSSEILAKKNQERMVAWLEKQGEQEQLYIRFGEIPTDEKSKIYQGEIEVGIENGVSVYPAFKTDEGDIVLGLNLPITKTTLYTQQHLIEYDNRPCYLVKGDYVGKDIDGQPLINNVSIIEKIDNYRVKEEKQGVSAIPQVYETKNGEVITYSESEGYKVVEPKFKNGQWIVWKDKCYKVNYNACGYELFDENGWSTSWDYKTIEDNAHIWTIQDAKDGDVLFLDLMGGQTFIYNGVNPNMAILYSFIINNDGEDVLPYHIGKPNTGIGCIKENENIIRPATKEQRDLLFQKMKEAGYEWSNKDRKLIKTEEQSEQGAINDTNEEVSEELKAASILHSELVRNQSCIDEDFIAGAQWLKRQNCAWSEEDEEMFNNIIEDDLMPYGEQDKIDWLNLLKERIN